VAPAMPINTPKTDANLKGNEYSTLSSIAAYAQLACQPLGAFLLVRFPINRLLAVLMFCWGGVLMGTRFL
jgi:hypothetical protein